MEENMIQSIPIGWEGDNERGRVRCQFQFKIFDFKLAFYIIISEEIQLQFQIFWFQIGILQLYIKISEEIQLQFKIFDFKLQQVSYYT